MSDQEANAPSSNTGCIIALVLVLLAMPCLAGVAILGGTVFFYRAAASRAVDEEQRARVAAESAEAAALSRAAASDTPNMGSRMTCH